MNGLHAGANAGLAVAAVLLSPIALIFSVPLLVGIGLDIIGLLGEASLAAVLCAPAVFLVFYCLRPMLVRTPREEQPALRLHLDRGAELNQPRADALS